METRRVSDIALALGFGGAITPEVNAQRSLGHGPDFVEGVAALVAQQPPHLKDL